MLSDVGTGRVEQENARTEKEAEKLQWCERKGLSNQTPKEKDTGKWHRGKPQFWVHKLSQTIQIITVSLGMFELYTELYLTYNACILRLIKVISALRRP